jgi:SAM-dependent methyltransferase
MTAARAPQERPTILSKSTGTRGSGLTEAFLAQRRIRMIRKLLGHDARPGRVLDLGCGSPPVFLAMLACGERYGAEKLWSPEAAAAAGACGVVAINCDLESPDPLPFADNYFDVVTMMAVLEHVEPETASRLLAEIRRVLKPGGVCLLTTPAGWTAPVLTAMAHLHLVSRVEIEDHKVAYSRPRLRAVLLEAGFDPQGLEVGSFQLGSNLWVRAVK